jgi:hypothetical protein
MCSQVRTSFAIEVIPDPLEHHNQFVIKLNQDENLPFLCSDRLTELLDQLATLYLMQ